jgi:hypothetical protein
MGMVVRKEDGRIEIPLSKVKLTMLIAASFAFVAIGLWILIFQPKSIIFRNQLFNSIMSVLAILFFGSAAIVLLLKLRDDNPGITIDRTGIHVNAGSVSFGLIKWDDIEDVKAILYNNKDLMLILVKNPEYYIERQNSFFNRKLMKISWKYLATPITISSNSLKCSFEQLKSILLSKFHENCKSIKT